MSSYVDKLTKEAHDFALLSINNKINFFHECITGINLNYNDDIMEALAEMQLAIDTCISLHSGVERKYSGGEYYLHPMRVAYTFYKFSIRNINKSNILLLYHVIKNMSAAYLHDIVEDTETSFTDLLNKGFSEDVVEKVWYLTDIKTPDLNRKNRKLSTIFRLRKANESIKNIKSFDIMDNLPSMIDNNKGFSKQYCKECKNLLDNMYNGSLNDFVTFLYKCISEFKKGCEYNYSERMAKFIIEE